MAVKWLAESLFSFAKASRPPATSSPLSKMSANVFSPSSCISFDFTLTSCARRSPSETRTGHHTPIDYSLREYVGGCLSHQLSSLAAWLYQGSDSGGRAPRPVR